MPEYLVRLVQMHEDFRKAELIALAEVANVNIEIVQYQEDVGVKLFFILHPSHSPQHVIIPR